MNAAPRRLGLVGCGRIGGPVLAAWQTGRLPGWEICGVLVRRVDVDRGRLFTTDIDGLLATRPDVVVEMAGPPALAAVGERVLRCADLWTVSGAALADAALLQRMEAAGRESGHRLRILSGAFAGMEGVSAAAAATGMTLHLTIELLPGPAPAERRFKGSVREAAGRFPNDVNVAAAAALAGPGLDATSIEVVHPGAAERNRLVLHAESAAGTLHVEVQPELGLGFHPTACNLIAALRRETQTVWVG